MRYKVTFLVGAGAGYVLGSRAGRERYDSLARATRGFVDTPAVQEAAGVLQAQVSSVVRRAGGRAAGAVGDSLGSTLAAATERVRAAGTGLPATADEAPGPVRV